MKNSPRQWFQITADIMVCIDFTLCSPVATIQTVVMGDTYDKWSPNQDADLYLMKAKALSKTKEFRFNPHNRNDTLNTLTSAVDWCSNILGPPIYRVSRLRLLIGCMMPWKYRILWNKFRIVGLIPRHMDKHYKEQRDSEWESIKRGFEKDSKN